MLQLGTSSCCFVAANWSRHAVRQLARHHAQPTSCWYLHCVCVSQAEVCGPTIAYVDDAAAMEAQLKQLLPSLQHVLADVLHVMKRVNETLTPHHPKTGETGSFEQCTTRVLC